MATPRAKRLQQLAMSMPQANQEQAQAAQQTRQIQLQEQVRKLQPGQGGPALAQQMGAQQQQKAGAIQLGAAQQGQQQAQLMGQMGLEEQARGQRQAGFEQQIAISKEQRQNANKLSALDVNLKKQLLDNQLEFRRDQAGKTILNERQLMDWAATKAENAEEYAKYAQAAQQVQQREIQLMQAAHNKISQALQQGYVKKGKALDRNLRVKLVQQKRAIENSIRDKQNKASNRSSMFQSGMAVVGAIGGGLITGTPMGAAAGASLGSGAGNILANV